MKTRVLVIDYMPLVRKILPQALAAGSNIEVVATAANAAIASRKLLPAAPDVIVLDAQPPPDNDVELLRDLLAQYPVPVVLLTALDEAARRTVAEALNVESANVIAKPARNIAQGLKAMVPAIQAKVTRAHQEDLLEWRKKSRLPLRPPPRITTALEMVIAIGASTGGTDAIRQILSELPPETPGILVVQHMPAGFTKRFAERLNELCNLGVKEAEDGDEVRPGRALLAPGGYQTRLVGSRHGFKVQVEEGPKVNGHCPSVDVLMTSVARHARAGAIGVLLTGMGSDGAAGMEALRQAGAATLGQDEKSSVVFGMPREAHRRGAVDRLVPLKDMAGQLLALLRR